jgi:hypothetical protein
MFRAACAALAITLALLLPGRPASAQDDEAAQAADETTSEEPADADAKKADANEEAETADADEEDAEEKDDEEPDYHRRGVYVGLAGSWAVEKFQDSDDINTEDSGGVNARVGYHALSWLSGEVQGEYLPRFDIDFGSDSGDLAIWLVGANLRLNLPTDLIQPYMTLGGGYMGADLSGASAGGRNYDGDGGYGRFGGGVEFYFWPFLAFDMGISYVLPAGDVDDLNFLSINFGGLYRF